MKITVWLELRGLSLGAHDMALFCSKGAFLVDYVTFYFGFRSCLWILLLTFHVTAGLGCAIFTDEVFCQCYFSGDLVIIPYNSYILLRHYLIS